MSAYAAPLNRALQWGFLLLAGVMATILTRTAVLEAHEAKRIIPLQGDMLLIEPRYNATLADGGTVEISASQAAPDKLPPNEISLAPVHAVLKKLNGTTVLEAKRGRYVLQQRVLYLSDGVRVRRNDGAWFNAQNAVVDTLRGTVNTSGRVQMQLPGKNLFTPKNKE